MNNGYNSNDSTKSTYRGTPGSHKQTVVFTGLHNIIKSGSSNIKRHSKPKTFRLSRIKRHNAIGKNKYNSTINNMIKTTKAKTLSAMKESQKKRRIARANAAAFAKRMREKYGLSESEHSSTTGSLTYKSNMSPSIRAYLTGLRTHMHQTKKARQTRRKQLQLKRQGIKYLHK